MISTKTNHKQSTPEAEIFFVLFGLTPFDQQLLGNKNIICVANMDKKVNSQ